MCLQLSSLVLIAQYIPIFCGWCRPLQWYYTSFTNKDLREAIKLNVQFWPHPISPVFLKNRADWWTSHCLRRKKELEIHGPVPMKRLQAGNKLSVNTYEQPSDYCSPVAQRLSELVSLIYLRCLKFILYRGGRVIFHNVYSATRVLFSGHPPSAQEL